ncbi:MAG: hypothetical protein HGB18_05210 [Candidatus Moranbacteria bacterium]|nr:hypothetical protein [Candidatus Moranbacteria bacterium]
MKRTEHPTIEEQILEVLRDGSVSTTELIRHVADLRTGVTKQGVYKALRKLKEEEKVVVAGKTVSLNLEWIHDMRDFFDSAERRYASKASAMGLLGVGEREKVVYFFRSLNQLDSFWGGNAFRIFSDGMDSDEPIFVYNPHEWFFYLRPETEQSLLRSMSKRTRQVLITVTHNDPLDRKLKAEFDGERFQYHISAKRISEKDNYYFNIFGDYLIEVLIDERIAKRIDEFYKRTKVFDEAARREVSTIASEIGRHKLIITKNRRRAEKYKKTLGKDFYIMKRSEKREAI